MIFDTIHNKHDLDIFYIENNINTLQDKINILSCNLNIWKYDICAYNINMLDNTKLDILESILLRRKYFVNS